MSPKTLFNNFRLYPDRIPDWFSERFKNYLWHGPRDQQIVHITFDDGPTPEVTDFVIKELAKHQFTATFFCIGDRVYRYPAFYNRLLESGHRIGNHTYDHLNAFRTNKRHYVTNVYNCSKLVTSKLFRPPYGRITSGITNQLKKEGYQIVLWDVLSGDFDTSRNAASCLHHLKKNTRNGSIIVFHDSEKSYEKLKVILPDYLLFLKEKGWISQGIN